MKAQRGVREYIGRLRRCLICRRATKDKLLEGFVQELQDNENTSMPGSYEELCRQYGQPEIVAKEFQEQVSSEEFRAVKTRRSIFACAAIVIGICVICFLLYMLYDIAINTEDLEIVETIIIHE